MSTTPFPSKKSDLFRKKICIIKALLKNKMVAFVTPENPGNGKNQLRYFHRKKEGGEVNGTSLDRSLKMKQLLQENFFPVTSPVGAGSVFFTPVSEFSIASPCRFLFLFVLFLRISYFSLLLLLLSFFSSFFFLYFVSNRRKGMKQSTFATDLEVARKNVSYKILHYFSLTLLWYNFFFFERAPMGLLKKRGGGG